MFASSVYPKSRQVEAWYKCEGVTGRVRKDVTEAMEMVGLPMFTTNIKLDLLGQQRLPRPANTMVGHDLTHFTEAQTPVASVSQRPIRFFSLSNLPASCSNAPPSKDTDM